MVAGCDNCVGRDDHRYGVTLAYADNDANEYTSIGGTAVTYDAAGNLTYDDRGYSLRRIFAGA